MTQARGRVTQDQRPGRGKGTWSVCSHYRTANEETGAFGISHALLFPADLWLFRL